MIDEDRSTWTLGQLADEVIEACELPMGCRATIIAALADAKAQGRDESKSGGEFRRMPGAWVVFEEAAEPGEAPSQGFYIDPQRAEHFAGERGFCKNHLAEVYIREPHKPVPSVSMDGEPFGDPHPLDACKGTSEGGENG